MLNESFSLMKSLRHVNTELTGHPLIQDFSEQGLFVFLQHDVTFAVKSMEKGEKLWRYKLNNHQIFPSAKIIGPFLNASIFPEEVQNLFKKNGKKKDEDLAKLHDFFQNFNTDDFEVANDKKVLDKFRKSWLGQALSIKKQFGEQLDSIKPLADIVDILISSTTKDVQQLQNVIRFLVIALIDAYRQGNVSQEILQTLLVGKFNKDSNSWESDGEVFIYFDVSERLVGTNECRMQFQDLLYQVESTNVNDSDNLPFCALTGKRLVSVNGTFPSVKLPVLKDTILMAMNKDIPCHKRYGKIAANICVVGEQTAKEIAIALRTITDDLQKGKTWQSIISDRNGKSDGNKKYDLFVAYYVLAPNNNVELAKVLDKGYDNSEEEQIDSDSDETLTLEDDFVPKTEAVINALKAQTGDSTLDGSVQCMILRKIDKARCQLLYSTVFKTSELFDSAVRWQRGSKNVPELTLFLPVHENLSKNQKISKSEPWILKGVKTISLESAQFLFQEKWIRGGKEVCAIIGISRAVIFNLFLNRGNIIVLAETLLRLLLDNCEELLTYIGGDLHLHLSIKNKHSEDKVNTNKESTVLRKTNNSAFIKQQRRRTLDCLSMLGILLDKLNSKKEVYMNQTAYNLGRLLSLADSLHIFYCQDLRSGDVPMTLIGNALIPVMKMNPVKALVRLSERARIYLGWAKKYFNNQGAGNSAVPEGKPEPRLVGWVMAEFGRISEAINASGDLKNQKLSDVEVAQLLLGYLAMPKRKEDKDSESSDVENGNVTE